MNGRISLSVSKRQLWLCLPLLMAYATDVTVTLFGQSAHYWAGAYYDVNEGNPISHWFLGIHPFAYLSYRIVVFAIIAFLITILPLRIAELISTSFFLAHTVGASGWLKDVFHIGYWVRTLLGFALAALFTYAYTQAEKPMSQSVRFRRKAISVQD